MKFSLHCVAALMLMSAFVSCASVPGTNVNSKTPPLWVTQPEEAYPADEWIVAVESASGKEQAAGAALTALTKIFRQDVKTETTAGLRYVDALLKTGKSSGNTQESTYTESKDFAQQVVTTSDVNSLIGVLQETWKSPDGRYYAIARINRREGSARYGALVAENERLIRKLTQDAQMLPGTFDAYHALSFALDAATVTDGFIDILNVLDTSRGGRRGNYGSATSVREQLRAVASEILIAVRIESDASESERVAAAFASYFASLGFKTTRQAAPAYSGYVLSGLFTIEELSLSIGGNKFVRYTLQASLLDLFGNEVLTYSDNAREGHRSFTEAKQRAIRSAEQHITSTFSGSFESYLASYE